MSFEQKLEKDWDLARQDSILAALERCVKENVKVDVFSKLLVLALEDGNFASKSVSDLWFSSVKHEPKRNSVASADSTTPPCNTKKRRKRWPPEKQAEFREAIFGYVSSNASRSTAQIIARMQQQFPGVKSYRVTTVLTELCDEGKIARPSSKRGVYLPKPQGSLAPAAHMRIIRHSVRSEAADAGEA